MEINCIQWDSVAIHGTLLYLYSWTVLVSLCTGGDGVSILSAITLATDIAKVFDVIWLDGEDESLFLTEDVVDTVVDTCVFVTDDVTVACDDVTAGGDFRFFSGSGFGSFWAWDCFTDSGTFYGVYNLWPPIFWSSSLAGRPPFHRSRSNINSSLFVPLFLSLAPMFHLWFCVFVIFYGFL